MATSSGCSITSWRPRDASSERPSNAAAPLANRAFASRVNNIPQLPDLGRQDDAPRADRLPAPQRVSRCDPRSRSCARPMSSTSTTTCLSDLVSHFRQQADAAKTPADAVYPRLALASILWWNDDKEEAIAEFTKVAEASKAESDLRLDLAELLEQQGERADALALADAVQPLDNATMKRREELALRLSVLTGNLDRARQAAERLFGLRLDTDTQVAARRPDAPARPARAGRGRAGPRPPPRRQQGHGARRPDAPVPAPGQARRRRPGRHADPPLDHGDPPDQPQRLHRRKTPTPAASAAIGVLARSGRLPQLIERANEQLKKTPNAIQLHQALADYYKAAGQRDKARAELAKIVALRPDDGNSAAPGRPAARAGGPGRGRPSSTTRSSSRKTRPSSARNFYQVRTPSSRPARPTS